MKNKRNYFIEIVDDYGDHRQFTKADRVSATYRKAGKDDPYREIVLEVIGVLKEYNPDYGDDRLCECGHAYYRHFDSWEGMAPVGCKYCKCDEFVPAEETNNG